MLESQTMQMTSLIFLLNPLLAVAIPAFFLKPICCVVTFKTLKCKNKKIL